ncbi:MAG TPA: ATP-binding protein [Anaerolineae bacterium]|nr:ATP-binding protein [Anaerolineae bacterium]
MMARPIGTAKGPGEAAHEYTFITPDREQTVRSGEFVYYEAPVDGELRQVLGRVAARRPVRLFPDGFLADPEVRPETVAGMIGYAPEEPELFEVTATILGYYDEALHDFVNPRLPPRAGHPIYIAEDELLARVLNRRVPGQVGAAHIGALLSRPGDAVPVVLDARAITSTHLAIIASTGAGKSYLAGVLLEELMAPHNRAAVLVVDPHGEYDTLAEMQGAAELRGDDGYHPEVRIIRPDDVKVRISSLTLGDLRYLLPNLSEKMHYRLGQAYRAVQRHFGKKWTRGQFKVALRSGSGKPVTDPRADDELDDAAAGSEQEEDSTLGALIWRVNQLFSESHIFDDYESLPLGELFRPGRCTVLQLNEVDQREQQVVVATLLRRLLQARIDTEKKKAAESDESYLPYPAFVLIEEAHNFCPASADVITSQILKTVLSEGRKFGVAVGLISQRPGRLDADVLSQCMTQCILRIVNPIDQNRVAESVESVGRDLLAELPALSKGQAVIAGAAVNTPLLCRVRRRITPHGAEDPDSPSRWQAWFAEGQDANRRRDLTLLLQPEKRGRGRLFKSE